MAANWHKDAVIVPPYRDRFVQRKFALGVLDREGAIIPGSACNLQRRSNIGYKPEPGTFEDDLVTLEGRWLFTGFFQPHFGHQITQCLGRLPWQGQSGPIDGIVFGGFPKGARLSKKQSFFRELLHVMGIDMPFVVTAKPTRIRELFVGESLFGEITQCVPDALFVDWSRSTLSPHIKPVKPGCRLYVSRNRLDPLLGRVLCEDVLEGNLERAGYELFYPEEHSLVEQLRRYSEAEVIVATDGSANHLMAFTQSPAQHIVVLARRKHRPVFIHNHLKGFFYRVA